MMNKEEYTIGFKDQTGFSISKCDLTTGKIVVNGIEITSVEDWEKVTNSLIDLQQRIDKTIHFIEEHNKNAGKLYYKYNNRYLLSEIKEDLLEILGGKE